MVIPSKKFSPSPKPAFNSSFVTTVEEAVEAAINHRASDIVCQNIIVSLDSWVNFWVMANFTTRINNKSCPSSSKGNSLSKTSQHTNTAIQDK